LREYSPETINSIVGACWVWQIVANTKLSDSSGVEPLANGPNGFGSPIKWGRGLIVSVRARSKNDRRVRFASATIRGTTEVGPKSQSQLLHRLVVISGGRASNKRADTQNNNDKAPRGWRPDSAKRPSRARGPRQGFGSGGRDEA
jgi:hypothetical protein